MGKVVEWRHGREAYAWLCGAMLGGGRIGRTSVELVVKD